MFTVYLMCSFFYFGLKKHYFGLEFQRAIFEIINSLEKSPTHVKLVSCLFIIHYFKYLRKSKILLKF